MLNWMMFWHVMSPPQPVVITQGQAGWTEGQPHPIAAPVQQESSHWFLWTLLIGVLLIVGFLLYQGRNNESLL
jgi:hypothetical protein